MHKCVVNEGYKMFEIGHHTGFHDRVSGSISDLNRQPHLLLITLTQPRLSLSLHVLIITGNLRTQISVRDQDFVSEILISPTKTRLRLSSSLRVFIFTWTNRDQISL